MYRSTRTCCTDHQVMINTNPALKAAVVLLGTKLDAIEAQYAKLASVITGLTAEKDRLKEEMVRKAANIASLLFAFAEATGDANLQSQSDFSVSDLGRARTEEIADVCAALHGLAATRSDELAGYGLTPVLLDALSDAIDDYRLLVEKPRAAKAAQTGARRILDELFREADAVLRKRVDKLMVLLRDAYPEFFEVYKASRVIFNPPVVHTRLKGFVRDAQGNPVENASITVQDGDFTATVFSGADGSYEKRLKYGIYRYTAEKAGYTSGSGSGLHVKLGSITHLDIVLETLA